jgi:8-amino-7-oxononanoate synthase
VKSSALARRVKREHAKNGRAPKDSRRHARAEFLAPFAPLLEQIEATRHSDLYPFFSTDRDSAPNGRPVVLVANDYLGLSADLRVRDAAREAIARFGTSRCASPLAGGQTTLHQTLATRLAEFLHQEAAALFASGYQANVGVISALMKSDDLILTDLFNHASIVDGARLSGAQVRHFQHNSATHLERILSQEASGRRVLVIVEGVYSADGDIGDLPDLCAVAHTHGALVMVDEAHSFGVLGDSGAGAAEHFELLDDVDLIVGTMSKSLASVGGFVAADQNLVDAIAHSARALIFSAALPPAGAAAALAALEILQREPGRRERLWRNTRAFLGGLAAAGLDTMRSVTPVIPILVGDPARTIELTARLRARGVHICPAIPPMVPAHLSRVRAHVTAAHETADLDAAVETIAAVGSPLGIPRAQRMGRASRGRLQSAAPRRPAALQA